MNWIYKSWWKWIAVVLLNYVAIGGFIVPLGPGIESVQPLTFTSDSLYTFTINGYNTHFKPADAATQVWFKSGNDYFCPVSTNIQNDKLIECTFKVPSGVVAELKKSSFDIVINNNTDGTFALREAVTLIRSTTVDSAAQEKPEKCSPKVAANNHQLFVFPYREILYESIRNTFFHVPMWFVMTMLVLYSLYTSIRYLMSGQKHWDVMSNEAIIVALLFGIAGILTGMIWANYTWGQPWLNDPKLNGAAVGVLIYFAYIVLRGSITDETKRARISAVYNIFAVIIFILFIFVLPRLTDSLHPGNGGNPAFSQYDLDNTLRLFFYPAVIGWIVLGFWILSVRARISLLEIRKNELL